MSTRPSPYRLNNEFWELHQSATNLTRYACIVSSRHIKDGLLRGRFNRDMAYYVRQILEDVRNGRIRTEEGLRKVEAEHKTLRRLSLEVGGVISGASMVTTGVGICYITAGTACALGGAPMIAHGANNAYENLSNLVRRRTDTVGPLRNAYQSTAIAAGGSAREGNIAYGVVDVVLSIYGLARLVKKDGAWKLFHTIRPDYTRAYKLMNKHALLLEFGISSWTTKQVIDEFEK